MMKLLKKLSFLFVLCSIFFPQKVFAELNIMFIGELASGKAELRAALSKHAFEIRSQPASFLWPLRYGDITPVCQLYDISGIPEAKMEIIKEELKEANIVVITLDASSDLTVENKADYANRVHEIADTWVKIVCDNQPKAPIILAITKKDTLNDAKIHVLTTQCEHIKGYYKDVRIDYVFTSAATGEGIGDSDHQDDFGDNLWGKIRTILRDTPEEKFAKFLEKDNRITFIKFPKELEEKRKEEEKNPVNPNEDDGGPCVIL